MDDAKKPELVTSWLEEWRGEGSRESGEAMRRQSVRKGRRIEAGTK